MRNIILMFIIVFCSCTSKDTEIENIEIMSYYYTTNKSQTEMIMAFVNYSTINDNGNAKTIQKVSH